MKTLFNKIKKSLIFILSLVPNVDPDEFGKRKYRAERDKYRKYQ